jgi:hypothetical protein
MSARATGAAGVASFVLLVVATLVEPLWDAPTTTTPERELVAYLADNSAGFIGSVTIYALAMTLFLVFAVGLWWWMGDPRDALHWLFLAGAVALTAMVLVGFVPTLVVAYRAPDVEGARELYDLSFGVLAFSGAPTAIATAAFAAIVLRTRSLPVLTAWLAVLAAVAHVVILFSFVPDDGFFSLEGGVIVAIPATLFFWMLATAVALWRTAP